MSIRCPNCVNGDVHITGSFHPWGPTDDRAFGYVVIRDSLYKIRCWVNRDTKEAYTKRWFLHCSSCGFNFDEMDMPLIWPNWERYRGNGDGNLPDALPKMQGPQINLPSRTLSLENEQ